MKVIILLNFIILSLVGYIAFKQHVHEQVLKNFLKEERKIQYFALDDSGRLEPILSLEDPYVSAKDLFKWIDKAIQESLFFNVENYKDKLHEASRFYSRRGWESFANFLQNSQITEFSSYSNCSVNSKISNSKILNQGTKNSRYFWDLSMDMLLDFSNCEREDENKKLFLTIVRAGYDANPSGIAIEGFEVKNAENQ